MSTAAGSRAADSPAADSPAAASRAPGSRAPDSPAVDWPGLIVAACGRPLQSGRATFALVAAVLAGTLAVRLAAPVNHDTAWYLTAAAQFLDGGTLYRDVFVDVNPPLGLFLTLPPVALARLADQAAADLIAVDLFAVEFFIAYLYLLIALSLALSWRLLGADPGLPPAMRRGLLVLAALALAVCPGDQFGQREHFLMVLALPYLLLAALGARGRAIPPAAAFAVGLAGGLGFAIKPHFLLVPAALELCRLAGAKPRRGPLRPETLGVAASLCAYAAVVAWAAPDYLARIVPWALEVYNQAYTNPLLPIVWRIETVMLPLGCLVHLATRRDQPAPQFGDAFMAAAAVLFAAYLAQMKGWDYQLYPASACLVLGYGALVLNRLAAPPDGARPPGPTSLTGGIAAAALVLIAILAGNDAARLGYQKRFTEVMTPYVERYAPGGAILVLGTNVSAGFPLVNVTGVAWSSRFPTLWLLPGVVRQRAAAGADAALLDEMERFTRDAVVADLAARPADVVIVDGRDRKDYFGDAPFDYLAYFGADPRFARIWRDYVRVGEAFDFQVYRRRCAPGCPAPAAAGTP